MIALLTENVGWKLLSLLLSVALWYTVARDAEIGTFVSVPVEYKGMPEDLEISSDVVGTVSIDIRGTAEKIAGFSGARSAIVLDFSSINRPGEKTFQIDDTNVSLPSGIRLVRAIPGQVRLQFEPRTSREVPVNVRFSGAPQKGYGIAHHEVTPKTLTIVGPDSRVKHVEFAVTDPIDLGPVVGISQFAVNAFVGDPHVRFAKPAKVMVRVVMEKK